ncbi:MAG: signal peptidase I [Candidatus Pacebacteria bacterium]|nr:signal peptidase I [Candidatus Paceibacterota bacterium]
MLSSLKYFKNMWRKIVWENLEMIFIAILIVIPIRHFLIQPFIVHGSSMEPNFYTRDYLIIDELTYRFRDPLRHEIVVFKAPNHSSQYYIKRIIGLPNETISIKDGQITVTTFSGDSFILQEDFLPSGLVTSGNLELTLGSDEYFVLGDNRLASYDSRNWGPVKKDLIIGRVWLCLWPAKRISAYGF